jgi:hypothetical protein
MVGKPAGPRPVDARGGQHLLHLTPTRPGLRRLLLAVKTPAVEPRVRQEVYIHVLVHSRAMQAG